MSPLDMKLYVHLGLFHIIVAFDENLGILYMLLCGLFPNPQEPSRQKYLLQRRGGGGDIPNGTYRSENTIFSPIFIGPESNHCLVEILKLMLSRDFEDEI